MISQAITGFFLACFGQGLALDRIHDAIVRELQRMESQLRCVESQYHFTVFDHHQAIQQQNQAHYIVSGVNYRATDTRMPREQSPNRYTSVNATNARYSFRLKSDNDTWKLVDLEPTDRNRIDQAHAYIATYHSPHLGDARLGLTYHQMLTDPATKILKRQWTSWRGHVCFEILFELPTDAYEGSPGPRRYSLYFHFLHPHHCFGLRIYHIPNLSEWVHEQVVTADYSAELPILKRLDVFGSHNSVHYLLQRIEYLEYIIHKEPRDEREFTLSAYGFREPTTIPERGMFVPTPPGMIVIDNSFRDAEEASPQFWPLLVVGGAGLVVALLAKRPGRRKGPTETEDAPSSHPGA
jgi:hypothetical protein